MEETDHLRRSSVRPSLVCNVMLAPMRAPIFSDNRSPITMALVARYSAAKVASRICCGRSDTRPSRRGSMAMMLVATSWLA